MQFKLGSIRHLLEMGTKYLNAAGVENAQREAEILLGHAMGVDRLFLWLQYQQKPCFSMRKTYGSYLRRRSRKEPTAYILGEKEFFGHGFYVNPDVLIPRADTEILLEQALEALPLQQAACVIDVGTGSGCLSIALALARPWAMVTAVDICERALAVASHNVKKHQVEGRVHLRQGSLLEPCQHMEQVDVIVSNPPYIKKSDFLDVQEDVRLYEPSVALCGENKEGVGHHYRILEMAWPILRISGRVFMEIGYDQATALGAVSGFKGPSFCPDLAGHWRVASFQKMERA